MTTLPEGYDQYGHHWHIPTKWCTIDEPTDDGFPFDSLHSCTVRRLVRYLPLLYRVGSGAINREEYQQLVEWYVKRENPNTPVSTLKSIEKTYLNKKDWIDSTILERWWEENWFVGVYDTSESQFHYHYPARYRALTGKSISMWSVAAYYNKYVNQLQIDNIERDGDNIIRFYTKPEVEHEKIEVAVNQVTFIADDSQKDEHNITELQLTFEQQKMAALVQDVDDNKIIDETDIQSIDQDDNHTVTKAELAEARGETVEELEEAEKKVEIELEGEEISPLPILEVIAADVKPDELKRAVLNNPNTDKTLSTYINTLVYLFTEYSHLKKNWGTWLVAVLGALKNATIRMFGDIKSTGFGKIKVVGAYIMHLIQELKENGEPELKEEDYVGDDTLSKTDFQHLFNTLKELIQMERTMELQLEHLQTNFDNAKARLAMDRLAQYNLSYLILEDRVDYLQSHYVPR